MRMCFSIKARARALIHAQARVSTEEHTHTRDRITQMVKLHPRAEQMQRGMKEEQPCTPDQLRCFSHSVKIP